MEAALIKGGGAPYDFTPGRWLEKEKIAPGAAPGLLPDPKGTIFRPFPAGFEEVSQVIKVT